MSREEVKDKLSIEKESLGFKVWYKNNKEEYTREQSVKGIMKKSYLDYMITFGIDNCDFQILINYSSPSISCHFDILF